MKRKRNKRTKKIWNTIEDFNATITGKLSYDTKENSDILNALSTCIERFLSQDWGDVSHAIIDSNEFHMKNHGCLIGLYKVSNESILITRSYKYRKAIIQYLSDYQKDMRDIYPPEAYEVFGKLCGLW